VPPTLLVSAIGQIDDVRTAVTLDLKEPGDAVFLLGTTRDETGASEYLRWQGERDGLEPPAGEPRPYVGNKAPRLDPDETLPLYRALEGAVGDGIVRSAATPARGGLGLALARAAMAGEHGLALDLDGCPDLRELPPDAALFSESNGRFVVTVAASDAEAFVARFEGLACHLVGKVTPQPRLVVRLGGGVVVDADVMELKKIWKERLADV
jgi:phosphoribosylformylglycinamidine synthase